MSFDKVVDSVEDIKKKFAAKVRLPHAPLFQGLKSFQPELSVICDTELSVLAQSSRHPLHSVQGTVECLEGLLPVVSLPYSTLLGPLQRVEGRLVAGWLHDRPLLLFLVNFQKHV